MDQCRTSRCSGCRKCSGYIELVDLLTAKVIANLIEREREPDPWQDEGGEGGAE